MSKRRLNQSVSLAHFGFTSKKVTPRDDQETPRDDADDAAASTALATRTVSESGLLSRPVTPQKEVKLRRSAQKTQQLRR
ncbi:Gephyrin [Dissostichus eleginoides]|uniref:Gephyrin n=1 Tax=Dissostichus eleginoides TaxID=100907 RepID=A0AAD9F3I7_DISEL|nr:Gephyrin [Dissostichus eleginoides]